MHPNLLIADFLFDSSRFFFPLWNLDLSSSFFMFTYSLAMSPAKLMQCDAPFVDATWHRHPAEWASMFVVAFGALRFQGFRGVHMRNFGEIIFLLYLCSENKTFW
jgi:hypothetical protein